MRLIRTKLHLAIPAGILFLFSSCIPVYKIGNTDTKAGGHSQPEMAISFKPYREISVGTRIRTAKDTTFFYASVVIQNTDAAKHIKLSAIKLTIHGYPDSSAGYFFRNRSVEKQTHPPHTIYHLLTKDSTFNNGQSIDLTVDHPYHFNYTFFKIRPKTFPHEMQMVVEASFEMEGKTENQRYVINYKKRLKKPYTW